MKWLLPGPHILFWKENTLGEEGVGSCCWLGTFYTTLDKRSSLGPPRAGGRLQTQLSGWPGPKGKTGQLGSQPYTVLRGALVGKQATPTGRGPDAGWGEWDRDNLRVPGPPAPGSSRGHGSLSSSSIYFCHFFWFHFLPFPFILHLCVCVFSFFDAFLSSLAFYPLTLTDHPNLSLLSHTY